MHFGAFFGSRERTEQYSAICLTAIRADVPSRAEVRPAKSADGEVFVRLDTPRTSPYHLTYSDWRGPLIIFVIRGKYASSAPSRPLFIRCIERDCAGFRSRECGLRHRKRRGHLHWRQHDRSDQRTVNSAPPPSVTLVIAQGATVVRGFSSQLNPSSVRFPGAVGYNNSGTVGTTFANVDFNYFWDDKQLQRRRKSGKHLHPLQ